MTDSDLTPEEFSEPGAEQRGGVIGRGTPIREEDARLRAVLEQKQFITGRISETVRYIGFGMLVIFYTVYSSDTQFSRNVVSGEPNLLKTLGICGSLAVLCDYLQYLCGNVSVRLALRNSDNAYMYICIYV
jgi:hypothetical protein